ncbi:MAG: alpha-2-macroglobulin family protein, partial [Alphaproteobacteria bacterium]
MALFSGIIEVGKDGVAVIPLNIPEFNGRLRLMAQAWTDQRVGAAETTMLVRRPVIATLSLPRFLSPGDEATISVSLRNISGVAGRYVASLTASGVLGAPLTAELAVDLKPGDPAETKAFDVAAIAPGDGAVTLDIIAPDGTRFQIERSLSVRPGSPAETRNIIARVGPGQSLNVPGDLLNGYYAESARVVVGLNPLPDLDLPSILMGLARYPYGCAEQTTSTATPLLFASEVAAAIGVRSALQPEEGVRKGIARLLGMQTYSGGFGYWNSSSEAGGWIAAYATDFLVQAAAQGHEVPKDPLSRALGRLSAYVDQSVRNGRGYDTAAYALYVRARAGVADPARVRRFGEAIIGAKGVSRLAAAFTGAALAAVGDQDQARKVFERGQRSEPLVKRRWYATYGSPVRDAAAMIALMAESKVVEWGDLEVAAKSLSGLIRGRRWLSTQEQAWIVRASAGLSKAATATGFAVEVDGARADGSSGGFYRAAIGGAALPALRNLGTGMVTGVVTLTAAPIEPLAAIDRGFAVKRTLFDRNGKRLDPTKIQQSDVVVVLLEGDQSAVGRARALLVDYLPAGFELENARLGGDSLGSYSWLGSLTAPEHIELRDDRFVAAFASRARSTFRVAYIARAVTTGRFAHGGARVEAMYQPEQF